MRWPAVVPGCWSGAPNGSTASSKAATWPTSRNAWTPTAGWCRICRRGCLDSPGNSAVGLSPDPYRPTKPPAVLNPLRPAPLRLRSPRNLAVAFERPFRVYCSTSEQPIRDDRRSADASHQANLAHRAVARDRGWPVDGRLSGGPGAAALRRRLVSSLAGVVRPTGIDADARDRGDGADLGVRGDLSVGQRPPGG